MSSIMSDSTNITVMTKICNFALTLTFDIDTKENHLQKLAGRKICDTLNVQLSTTVVMQITYHDY